MWNWSIVTGDIFFKTLTKNCLFITKMPFYAVAKGRTPGIFMTWADCEAQVKGFRDAKYKKFDNVVAAQNFISTLSSGSVPCKVKKCESTSTSSNLKRPFTTTNNQHKTFLNNTDDDGFSDEWNEVLSKHMDDVEQGLQSAQKVVDNRNKKDRKRTILIESSQTKRQKISGGEEFDIDHDGFVQVYTDGACSANGRSGARAGLGVYWGASHPLNVSEPVSGRATNNCGEIQAATKAIKQALQHDIKKLSINTDSQFLINSVTKWIPGWKKKGWKLKSGQPVKNENDFKDLDSVQNRLQIKWNYVEAHKGIHGNEMADQLAKEGAARYTI